MRIVEKGQLAGEFQGFEDEKTIFEFNNGNKWRQNEYKNHYHYAYMPKAKVIEKGGYFILEVERVNQTVKVVRDN